MGERIQFIKQDKPEYIIKYLNKLIALMREYGLDNNSSVFKALKSHRKQLKTKLSNGERFTVSKKRSKKIKLIIDELYDLLIEQKNMEALGSIQEEMLKVGRNIRQNKHQEKNQLLGPVNTISITLL